MKSKWIALAVAMAVLSVLAVAAIAWYPTYRLRRIADTTVQLIADGRYDRTTRMHAQFHNICINNKRRKDTARGIVLDLLKNGDRTSVLAAFALGEGAKNYGFTDVFCSNHRIIMPHAIALAREADPKLAWQGRYILAHMTLSPDAFHAGPEKWPSSEFMIAHFREREEGFYARDEFWAEKLRSRDE